MSTPLTKNWHISEPITPQADRALAQFSPPFRQILYNRGYHDLESALAYLQARCPDGCAPGNMLGMQTAVERIRFAIRHDEPIAIYGDYDVDGVTATALLTLALTSLGATVRGYIPNRFEEGYGLNMDALDALKADGVRLVITVDCGVRSLPEAEHAHKIGLDMIITDHHSPAAELPVALAILNPKQPGDAYPDQDLAGVGLAYKLAEGLLSDEAGMGRRGDAGNYLDLVALGTVADLAPLTGENRHLVRRGLQAMQAGRRQGVLSLAGVCGIAPASISAEHIGFMLGPRLNAAGRLESAMASLRLLLSTELSEAAGIAQVLDNQNRERQQITKEIQESAEKLALQADPDSLLMFAADAGYNPGVIGLAASRLSEQYYRPAIVAHRGEHYTRGSCRSIPEFHITDALDTCADLLVRHGGHSAAAGFTVMNKNLDELVQRLQNLARRKLGDLELRPTLKADADTGLADLKPAILKELDLLQPTGASNPPATFVSRGVKVLRARSVGKDAAHLKLTVTDGRITYEAIAFRMGHWMGKLPQYIDLMYRFEVNEFNGTQSLQLNVKDIKPAGTF